MAWYHTGCQRPHMDQVVLAPGAVRFEESRRMLMVSAAHRMLYESPWINMLLKLDTEDYPAIVIKANDSTRLLKDHPLKIAFSFVKGGTGNLLALFTEIEAPSPFNCPTKPLVYFEYVMGLDHESNRSRLLEQLTADRFHLWLAEGGSATVENGIMSAEAVEVKYEAMLEVEPDCRAKLSQMVTPHFEEHLRIGASRWDFQGAFDVFSQEMPTTVSPILAPSGEIRTAPDASVAEPEGAARFVVIFVRGDPGWSTLPDSLKQFITAKAEAANIALTTTTQFNLYRKMDAEVAKAKQGESVGILAVMEIAAKLGDMTMVEDYTNQRMRITEFYSPRSGSFFKRTRDAAVTIICE